MVRVSDPAAFVAALGLYFGEGPSEGYRPGSMTDGPGRVREAEEAGERVERFLEAEYPMIPTPLRRRIVNAVGYHLWK